MDTTQFTYYLEQLCCSEDAFFTLLTHTTESDIPQLTTAYKTATEVKVQALLVEIIAQHRDAETLHFLGDVLQHYDPQIWRAALDAIVSIGTLLATEILLTEKERLVLSSLDRTRLKLEYIDEAIQQSAGL